MENYATIIFTIPDSDGFTYRVPPEFREYVKPGVQVVAPLGKRYLTGIVLELSQEAPENLDEKEIRSIQDIVYEEPVVTGELISLLKWISEYYICHLGEAYRLVQHSLNVGNSELVVKRTIEELPSRLGKAQQEILAVLPVGEEVPLKKIRRMVKRPSLSAILQKMEKEGWVQRRFTEATTKKILRTEDYFRLVPAEIRDDKLRGEYLKLKDGRLTKARLLLEFLEGKNWVSFTTIRGEGFTRQVVTRLVQRQLVETEQRPLNRTFDLPYGEVIEDVRLTADQQEVVDRVESFIRKREFKPFLLHGITGSGKTQIYIELIRRVLELGRQAIVLIPEIVLTPQTLTRFRHYFGERVGVLHSRLSAGEKREMLYHTRQGKFQVIIGPRSAIFAPVQNLGLVVVDEEHETSYKQTDAQPHYHARDVAIYRAYLNNAVVVLGSATPSFESLYNARSGQYEYFQLARRVEERALPRIALVDLREEWKKGGQQPVISESLELKIETRLLTREQVMILQNRRGYAPYLLCRDCGFVAKCPNCDITLTYHQTTRKLLCHYCGYREKAPDVCPKCEGMDILYKGIGTQRLEEELNEKFPDARTLRMDQDTTRGKHGHLRILEKFRNGEGDILLGTKMIAKGLDFRRVTLVGIISADQGLHFPDFRASEKVFQLLTQAAGRAGRGESSGEVVIQTFDPNHYIFTYLLTHDYLRFYSREMETRQTLNYPPFSRLMLIRVEGKNLEQVQKYSQAVVNFLWKANREKKFAILGPAPAPIARVQEIYRYHILIKQDKQKDAALAAVRRIVREGLYLNPAIKKWPVKLVIDVDPVEIL